MSNLEKIQKAMKVFEILAKIAMIFSFIATAFTLIGGIITLLSDTMPFANLLEKIFIAYNQMPSKQELGIILLCESGTLLLGSIISIFVYQYFKLELSEGTPFTETGAKKIKQLGIIFIAADIFTAVFFSAMKAFFFASEYIGNNEDTDGIILGICLILLAMLIRYGAELEQRTKTK